MVEDREVNLKFKYSIDESALKRVDKANLDLESRLTSLSQSTAAIGDSAARSGKTLQDAFSRSEASIRADQKAVDDLRKSLGGAAQDAQGLNATGSAGVGGLKDIGGLRRTGGALSQLGFGEIGGAVSRVGDIQQVAREIDTVAGAFKQLPAPLGAIAAAAGPLVLILGAASLGMKVWNDGLAAADTAIRRSSDQLSAYYAIIKDGTTESIKAQIKTLQAEKAITDAELKDRETNLKAMQDKNLTEARANTDFWGELAGELEQAGLRAGPLTEKIKELKDKSANAQIQIDAYSKALGSDAVAANNAAEAQKRLAAERLKGIDRQMSAEIEYAELAKNGSTDQAKKQIESLEIQATAVANAYSKALEGTDEDSQARATQLKQQYDQITNHIKDLKNLTPQLAANDTARKAAEDAKKAATDYAQALQRTEDITKRATKAEQDFNDETARTARDRARSDIREDQDLARRTARESSALAVSERRESLDLARQKAREGSALALSERRESEDIARDRAKRLAAILKESDQAEVQAREQEAKDAAKFQLDQQRATADHFDKLADIERSRLDAVFDAATNLDASAVFQAQRDALRSTQDENRDFGKQTGRAAEDEQNREQEAAQQRAVERENRLAAYREQLADEDAQRTFEKARRDEDRAIREQQESEDRAITQARRAEDRAIKTQEETEDRAIAKTRRDEDRAIQDADRKAARDKQIAEEKDALQKETDARSKAIATATKDEQAFWSGFSADARDALDSARRDLTNFKSAAQGGTGSAGGGQTGGGSVGSATTPAGRVITQTKTTTTYQRRNLLDGFAGGGDPPLGRPVLVGEGGAEAVVFKEPARVIPADQTLSALNAFGRQAGGSRPISLSIGSIPVTVNGDTGGITPARIQQAVVDALYEVIPDTIGGVG